MKLDLGLILNGEERISIKKISINPIANPTQSQLRIDA